MIIFPLGFSTIIFKTCSTQVTLFHVWCQRSTTCFQLHQLHPTSRNVLLTWRTSRNISIIYTVAIPFLDFDYMPMNDNIFYHCFKNHIGDQVSWYKKNDESNHCEMHYQISVRRFWYNSFLIFIQDYINWKRNIFFNTSVLISYFEFLLFSSLYIN